MSSTFIYHAFLASMITFFLTCSVSIDFLLFFPIILRTTTFKRIFILESSDSNCGFETLIN